LVLLFMTDVATSYAIAATLDPILACVLATRKHRNVRV